MNTENKSPNTTKVIGPYGVEITWPRPKWTNVGDKWCTTIRYCDSRRSCNDTFVDLASDGYYSWKRRTLHICLGPGNYALLLWRRYTGSGYMAWNVLGYYTVQFGELYKLEWGFCDDTPPDVIYYQAKDAIDFLKTYKFFDRDIVERWLSPIYRLLSEELVREIEAEIESDAQN
jgi:hypothetical protein